MKKSLVAFILTLTLILGVLSAPAMAFYGDDWNQGNNTKNYIHTGNRHRVISVSHGILAKFCLSLTIGILTSLTGMLTFLMRCISQNLK